MPKGVYKRTKTIPINRFLDSICIDENTKCWNWKKSKLQCGYGTFWDGEKKMLSHRWSYEFHRKKIEPNLQIDHLCRNRACCNPEHLEEVTNAENGRRGLSGYHMKEKSKLITHCPYGHEYTKENSYVRKNKRGWSGRSCRECDRERVRRGRRSRKEAQIVSGQN